MRSAKIELNSILYLVQCEHQLERLIRNVLFG